ncbi:hypothetical protein ACTFIZ_011453 [Dictyostelium cf. discoideum]
MGEPTRVLTENQLVRKREIDNEEHIISNPTNANTNERSNIQIKKAKVYSQIAAELYNDAGIHLDFVNAINQLNNNIEILREELNQNFQTITNGVNQLITFSTQTNFIHHINNIKHYNNLTRNQNVQRSTQHLEYLEILKENQGDGGFNWMGPVNDAVHGQIGQSYPGFPLTQNHVISLNNHQIDHLAFFYNDSFGIVVGDVLSTKRTKIGEWITCHQPIQLLPPYTEEQQPQQPPQPPQPLQKPVIKMGAKKPAAN